MSELWSLVYGLILPVVAILAGVSISVYVMLGRSQDPRWTARAYLFLALFGIGWGALALAEFHWSQDLGRKGALVIGYFRTLCVGLLLGVSLTLGLAGQLSRRKTR